MAIKFVILDSNINGQFNYNSEIRNHVNCTTKKGFSVATFLKTKSLVKARKEYLPCSIWIEEEHLISQ